MKKTFLVLVIIAIAMIRYRICCILAPCPLENQGFYDVTSSPSGAAVTVDGTSSGTTPTTATVIVGASGHTIAVNKAGFEPWSKYVACSDSRTTCSCQCRSGGNPDSNPDSRSRQSEGILQGQFRPYRGKCTIRWDELWD